MYNFKLNILVYIIVALLYTTIYGKIISKEELLDITNESYISYYCKDNICTDDIQNGTTIEIPDKK